MFAEYPDAFIWRCDHCPNEAIFPPDDFWGALGQLKSRGWQITRDDDGWSHACAKCQRERSAKILDMPSNKVRGM
jgi:hypothetical protein